MNPELAIAFDEFGLRSLVEGFLSRVHHHPDPKGLKAYLDPRLAGDPSALYPDPGPARILERQPWLDGHPHRRLEHLRFEVPGERIAGTAYAFWAGAGRPTALVLHGGLVGVDPRGMDLKPYIRWCEDLAAMGMNALFVELPSHLSRTPSGRFSGELFVSGDLIRTLDMVRQAVLEVRSLVSWLEAEGQGPCGILGMSLGGFVSTQVLSAEPRLSFGALLAPVPEPARTFSESLLGDTLRPDWSAPGLTLQDLDALFAHVKPASFTPKGPRGEDLLLVAARYDQTVRLEDMQTLAEAWGAGMQTFELGHFALPTHRAVTREALYPFLSRYV